MTVRLAGLSLALMLFVSMMAAPRPQAQASAPDPVFFQSQVFPVFEAAKCSGCHTASGVASATRLHFPDKDATPAQIQAFGLSLSSLVDRADVAKSLLLAKPTNVIRHTGGLRIKPGSSEEQILDQMGRVACVGVRCESRRRDEIAGRRRRRGGTEAVGAPPYPRAVRQHRA